MNSKSPKPKMHIRTEIYLDGLSVIFIGFFVGWCVWMGWILPSDAHPSFSAKLAGFDGLLAVGGLFWLLRRYGDRWNGNLIRRPWVKLLLALAIITIFILKNNWSKS